MIVNGIIFISKNRLMASGLARSCCSGSCDSRIDSLRTVVKICRACNYRWFVTTISLYSYRKMTIDMVPASIGCGIIYGGSSYWETGRVSM
jgi:hypothetical protein